MSVASDYPGGSGGMSKRQDEIVTVAPEMRGIWLAGQIDEVEALLQPFRDEVAALTSELHMTRDEMRANSNRVVWAVATASLTLFVSSVGVIVTFLLTQSGS